jgi:hypothetical protein
MTYTLASELEHDLGVKEISRIYAARADQLRATIQRKYWDSTKGLYADTETKDVYSQHTNTLAILTRLVEGEKATTLARKLLSDTTLAPASIYFKYYLHPDKLFGIFARNDRGRLHGLAIVFIEESPAGRTAYLQDLAWTEGAADVVYPLLCTALKLAGEQRADRLVTLTGRQALRGVYWELGFLPGARSAPAVLLKPPPGLPLEAIERDSEWWHGAMF